VMHGTASWSPPCCASGTVPRVAQRRDGPWGPHPEGRLGVRDTDSSSGTFAVAARPGCHAAAGAARSAGQDLNLSKLRKGKEAQSLKSWAHFWRKELQVPGPA